VPSDGNSVAKQHEIAPLLQSVLVTLAKRGCTARGSKSLVVKRDAAVENTGSE
jgi:hypothetical protein